MPTAAVGAASSTGVKKCILKSMLEQTIQAAFPFLLEPELRGQIASQGREMWLTPGEELMKPGQYIKAIPLVIEGRIRIGREDGEGGEMFLYFLGPGQTCAMSLSCCSADQKSSVRAVVEENSHIISIPIRYLDEWMLQFPSWKNFVLQTYHFRFQEIMRAFDAVAFLRMDERLLQYLGERRQVAGSAVLNLSHQDIAQELNTSREVISRLLKRMEHDGLLRLGRNRIELLEAV